MQPVDRKHVIERDSPIPIYHQIATDIIERISLGEWNIGDKLPSEAEMRAEYDVSAITLRQALKHLEDAQLIIRHQGKGSFLRETPKPFVEDLSLPGTLPDTPSKNISRIIEWRREEKVSFALRQAFHIQESGPFVFLRRVFVREDKLLGLNDVWFPEAAVPGMMENGLENGSISFTLQNRYGYTIKGIENFIESAKLNAIEAALLEAPYDSPVLRIFSAHKAAEDKIIEYSCTSWLGNLTRFHITVDARRQNIRR